jgi:hypothetical protein
MMIEELLSYEGRYKFVLSEKVHCYNPKRISKQCRRRIESYSLQLEALFIYFNAHNFVTNLIPTLHIPILRE